MKVQNVTEMYIYTNKILVTTINYPHYNSKTITSPIVK